MCSYTAGLRKQNRLRCRLSLSMSEPKSISSSVTLRVSAVSWLMNCFSWSLMPSMMQSQLSCDGTQPYLSPKSPMKNGLDSLMLSMHSRSTWFSRSFSAICWVLTPQRRSMKSTWMCLGANACATAGYTRFMMASRSASISQNVLLIKILMFL